MVLLLRRAATPFPSRLKSLLSSQGYIQAFDDSASAAGMCTDAVPRRSADVGDIKMSPCKTFSSKKLGIRESMISSSSWTVLKVLQSSGFRSYLVGGCVRDLILHRVPKDFDVVTTATLKEIKKRFHRCCIVGKRFPICRVRIKDSIVEISSFETVAQNTETREDFLSANMPVLSDGANVIMWRNSMSRDFTVNSLFFNPFASKIFDFANGMEDLRSLTLRTLLPARLSFKEDCAIILRGLRIAARLGLRLTKEIEDAIEGFLPAVISLSKARLMMELNYMMCYGAALPSLLMLKKYGLLEVLLPFQVAYLCDNTSAKPAQSSSMLVKLISNLDKRISCDRPCNSTLWVSIVAFHLALVNHSQDALVIWAFASVLYHGQWKEGVEFAIRHAGEQVEFVPETPGSSSFDMAELAERVSGLASQAQEYAAILSDDDFIFECPNIPSSGLVLISKKVAKDVGAIFQPLVNDVESFNTKRKSFEIDYCLLGKGFLPETRFTLGKIILDTLNDGVLQGEGKSNNVEEGNMHNLWKEHVLVNKKNKRMAPSTLLAEEQSKNETEISQKTSNNVLPIEVTNKPKKLKLRKRSSSEEKTESKKPKVVKVKRSTKIVSSVPETHDENPNSVSEEERKSVLDCSLSEKQQDALCSNSLRKSTNKRVKSSRNKAGANKKSDRRKQRETAKANTNPLLSDIFR
ncbi:hypothetical protein MLD38_004747 [Melastoma candidum]|uniref:Uncharacterized protein n=2 Tax=Melastoma candidum TaxID=119954 RepID=A0ACB9S876_9MYRT|nr:hypothetical protein MLD38_004747 [Melastoma candidum]